MSLETDTPIAIKMEPLNTHKLMTERKISFIIPALNEADMIVFFLQSLQYLREQGHELILVDGGSEDNTVTLAAPWVDQLLRTAKGRARQQNHGAAMARYPCLVFLHADTLFSMACYHGLLDSLNTCIKEQNEYFWGRFQVKFDDQRLIFGVIATMMNWRSCISAIATGDQAIFVSRRLFERVGGFDDLALMEDIALSRKMKQIVRPLCLRQKVVTSARRWQNRGIVKTILTMWWLRLQFFLGVDSKKLCRQYDS